MSTDPEFVTYKQWDSYAKRIVKFNLNRHHSSPAQASISARANSFIVEIQDDRKGMIVNPGWREAMRGESAKPGMLDITREPVDSDNVKTAGYDDEQQVIQVEFTDGLIYEYYDRPESVWQDFSASGSKGSFIATKLTPMGKYRKVS